jgi:hypothetical protein
MSQEDLGIRGNCHFSILFDAGNVGHFQIVPVDGLAGAQRSLDNANVFETTV